MPHGRYRKYANTVLVQYNISDAIDSLTYTGYLSTDIDAAARIVPLQFHPKNDRVLFERESWWNASPEICEDAALRVQRKFDGWYTNRATPVEKGYLSIIGLLHSSDVIKQIIDSAVDLLVEKHRIEMVDSDDAIVTINDYPATCDPTNVTAVLDLPTQQTAIRAMQQLARRIATAPPVQLEDVQKWFDGNVALRDSVHEYYYKNIFARTGVSPKRARKVIARSYELLQRFVGRERARQFIHGEEMRITAHHLVWGLQIDPMRIIERTIEPSRVHTPFVLTLYDHDGNKLCKGCVLWPETPVFDQAVGFLVSTASPEGELELIEQTNCSFITPAGRDHPVLKPKLRRGDIYVEHEDEPARETIDLRQEAADIVVTEEFVTAVDDEIPDPGTAEPLEALLEITEPVYDVSSRIVNVGDQRLSLDDPDFDNQFYASVARRQQARREERLRNPLIQRVQQMFFSRIDAPPELLDMMSTLEPRDRWDRSNLTSNLPECVSRYVTTKQFQ